MRTFALLIAGIGVFSLLGFRSGGSDAKKAQEAKARLAALPRLSSITWQKMLERHGWLYGSMSAKIKVIGLLTPKADLAARNVLFGSPTRDGDVACKTILLPGEVSPNWNLAAKLRIAYALVEPNKYKTPKIVLNKAKQIAEPRVGQFEEEWQALPEDIQKRATEEFESNTELVKQVKIDTFYIALPSGDVVEVGHPLNVDKVWTDYLVSKAAD